MFYKHKKAYYKHVDHCSGKRGFIYCFQNENMETYEKYLKHKKDFPFIVTGNFETTTGYIFDIEGGSMFATSYVLMFNFHPRFNMSPIISLRSFVQNEKELKHISIPENFHEYIDHRDLSYFSDACNRVLEKKEKQAISALCMIELWMTYQALYKYFDTVVEVKNRELTDKGKSNFMNFTEYNPKDKKATHCYICEMPLDCILLIHSNLLVLKFGTMIHLLQ